MLILAIESSCDDTSASVFDAQHYKVISNIVSSQDNIHVRFGGIVPELASRCHIEMIWPVVQQALDDAAITIDDIDLVCATQGPGLVGSLLVGFTFAKAIALVKNIPCVGVDHMAGHLLSCMLEQKKPQYPYTALIVSGGNTSLFAVHGSTKFNLLGRTRDDAAGEAFDKVAKLLGLGYPGGPVISQLALQGNKNSISFPRAWLDRDSMDFSFSGLKTSVMNFVHNCKQKNEPLPVNDICASFQEAVIEVLAIKTVSAAKKNNHSRVVLGGGVASNGRLREELSHLCEREGIQLYTPRPEYCTDNAAMIALAGLYLFQHGYRTSYDDDAYSRSPLN